MRATLYDFRLILFIERNILTYFIYEFSTKFVQRTAWFSSYLRFIFETPASLELSEEISRTIFVFHVSKPRNFILSYVSVASKIIETFCLRILSSWSYATRRNTNFRWYSISRQVKDKRRCVLNRILFYFYSQIITVQISFIKKQYNIAPRQLIRSFSYFIASQISYYSLTYPTVYCNALST